MRLMSSNRKKTDYDGETVYLYIIQNLRQTSFITHGFLAPFTGISLLQKCRHQ
jgi:hypothetical protein